ncbi:MAG: hypothetical protein ACXV5Q_01380 [Frankiaceae bacterium]
MAIQPVVRVSFGDEHFDVVNLMATDVRKIRAWTGCSNKQAWLQALGEQDIDAITAAYVLMRQRRGESIRFDDADFDTDDLTIDTLDPKTERPISPKWVLDAEGEPALNSKNQPVPEKDAHGQPVWTFDDDGSTVPPTSKA